MPGKKKIEETYEELEPTSRAPRVIACAGFYLIAALFAYALFAGSGSPFAGVKHVLCGLGGVLAFLIPVFLAWIATLILFSLRGKRVSWIRSALFALIFPCLHTMLHIFFVPKILERYMTFPTHSNHITQSFKYEAGGGAIGALLAWPLQRKLGTALAFIAMLFVLALLLLGSGKIKAIAAKFRRHKSEDDLFDRYDFPNPDDRRVEIIEPEKKPRGKKKAEPIEEQPARRGKKIETFEEAPTRRGRNAEPADPEPRRNFDSERASRRGENLDEGVKRRRSEDYDAPKRSPRSGQLYNENIESPRARRKAVDRDEPSSGRARRRSAEEEPAYRETSRRVSEEPDYRDTSRRVSEEPAYRTPSRRAGDNTIYAEPPRRLESQTARRGSDAPSRRAVEEEPASRKDDFDPDDLFEVSGDLTIEPEHADVLEGDAPPELSKQAKKPLGKLKRPPVKAPSDDEESYNYPPIDLLTEGEKVQESYHDDDMEKAQLLETTLKQFGISTKLTGIAHGPAVTRFEVLPAAGIKVNKITQLADDIAMRLAAMSVRIEAPIPGKSAVGVEIPNSKIETVRLRDVLESAEARNSASKLAVGLGKDNSGRYIVADIAKMPHVLIAGQTGSGKSVCINSIITSILFRATPDEVKLILIDPKVVELSVYNGIPHLVCPVVTDCKKAASALQWAVMEMERRYKVFAEHGVRDIKGYNKELPEGEKPMPKMVIIIDELADLMMVAQGDVEDSICRLAQLARAAGMHLVIATQRPSVNVITGTIKANIPTRIAFSVASQIDSRTMIDHGGAEKLLGNGDMLFVPSGINKPMRVQGAWVSDEEVHAITTYIKSNSETDYDQDMIERMEKATMSDAEKEDYNSEYDDRLPEAVEIVVEAGQASVSMLQRRMRVGYARAGRLIDEMEQRGIVSEADGSKPRSVLITREQMNELFE